MESYRIKANVSYKLTFMSFLFTMVIVMYHAPFTALNLNYIPGRVSIVRNFFDFIASLAMAYFFLTTGYLLYFNALEDNKYRKLNSRVRSLIIPFLLWNLIYCVGYRLMKVEIPINGIGDWIKKFTIFPYDGPLWYVFAITVLMCFLPLVIKLRGNKKGCLSLLGIITILSTILYVAYDRGHMTQIEESLPDLFWYARLARYLPAYCVGATVGLLKPELIEKKIKSKPVVITGVILSGIFMLGDMAIPIIPQLSFIKGFLFMHGIILVTIFIWMLVPSSIFQSRWKFCSNAFLFYAAHRIIHENFHNYTTRFVNDLHLPIIIACFVDPIISALIVYIIVNGVVWILKKIHGEKVVQILSGGR